MVPQFVETAAIDPDSDNEATKHKDGENSLQNERNGNGLEHWDVLRGHQRWLESGCTHFKAPISLKYYRLFRSTVNSFDF